MTDAEKPRLYLITPPLADADAFLSGLEAAMDAGDVASVLLRFATNDPSARKKIVRALAASAQSRGAALLVEGDAQLAVRADADGAHLAGPGEPFEAALDTLRPERIVGAGRLKTRDDAMTAGEDGADYVMFGEPAPDGYAPPVAETIERLDWWSQIFQVPCVGYAPALSDVAALCAAGADFVALGGAVWSDARGPAAAVAEAQAALTARGPAA